MKKSLLSFDIKDRSRLAFDLILLYLTMMLTLFGLFTMRKEGLGTEAALAIFFSMLTVAGAIYIIKKEAEKENEQNNKDESPAVKEKNKSCTSRLGGAVAILFLIIIAFFVVLELYPITDPIVIFIISTSLSGLSFILGLFCASSSNNELMKKLDRIENAICSPQNPPDPNNITPEEKTDFKGN